MDDDCWEARMAARARERAAQRDADAAEQQRVELESLGRLPEWLKGNHQVSEDGTTVWMFPSDRCICCGTPRGICCFAYGSDYVPPPEPDWPFSYEHCPLCRTERHAWSDTFESATSSFSRVPDKTTLAHRRSDGPGFQEPR